MNEFSAAGKILQDRGRKVDLGVLEPESRCIEDQFRVTQSLAYRGDGSFEIKSRFMVRSWSYLAPYLWEPVGGLTTATFASFSQSLYSSGTIPNRVRKDR